MIGQSAGKSYAYLLGVYLGDGCVTTMATQIVFRFNTIDRDFADAVEKAFWEIGARAVNVCTYEVSKSSKPNHSLTARHDDFCKQAVEVTNNKQILPSDVWQWPRDRQIAFIVGIMDSEGFVARHSARAKEEEAHWKRTNRSYYMGFKSCDAWVPEFHRLLELVGVKPGKIGIEKPLKPGYKTPRRFAIKIQSWVDSGCRFNIRRKQERVDIWAAATPYTERSRCPRRLTPETATLNAA